MARVTAGAGEIAGLLAGRIDQLAGELLPGGHREGADSGDVARSFRDHVARCSDMMSPA
jgi:hypothetical protein